MAKKLTKKYSKLLNEQLGNGAVILLIIAVIIVSVGSVLHINLDNVLAEDKNSGGVIGNLQINI